MFNKLTKSLQKVFGNKHDREFKAYSPKVDEINEYFDSYSNLSNDELRDKVKKERDEHLEKILAELLPEAFAVVKETARREVQWNMLHYDVQLIGGMVLHEGKIAEMMTGEGKTLVATLPAYLNGLSGLGVHLVTVNNYLARRDSEWVGPIFEFLYLTVDCIDKYQPHSPDRKKAYNCDITYGTNNEFGFDYLRDNMVRSKDEMVQGKHHFCMIDEVDSVLIDDARTPLIISGPVPEGDEEQEYNELKPKVEKLIAAQLDEKNRNVELIERGNELLSKGESDAGFFIMPDIAMEMNAIEMAESYTLFERDDEYVVLDNQVKIVDEQTGRMMEGRRYSDGLHQALEAKENVKVGDLTQTYATVTLQNYFRMYHKLSGMTGTAETEASELWEIYKLDVSVIPTNRPIQRDDREDLVFKTAREKYNAVIDEIVQLTQAGRPVLVGTTSVDISEKLSRMLDLRKISHNVLNAKQHQREAEIVAGAGQAGAVTIATNMAGRGTDIKLGDGVKAAGGLAIVGTERHDSRRVDRQLRGRAGRQGDPGSSQFYVSLEDNLMRLFHSERIAKVMDRMGHQDGEVIQHSMVTKSIERAQKKHEENNFGIRKRLLEYDDVMNIQREAIYSRRFNALSGERLSLDLNNMFLSMTESLVEVHKANQDFKSFELDSLGIIGVEPPFEEIDFNAGKEADLIAQYQQAALDHYAQKGEQEALESEGKSVMRDIEKAVTLSLIDDNWKEHLRNMDELKDSSQAASFEQKDPLVIYKMQAYDLFENLVYKVNQEVTSYLFEDEAREQKTDFSKASTNRDEAARRRAAMQAGAAERQQIETVKREGQKVGRNDACPCGSGKKFKQCHGRR
ncbi:UNVERIFIED_CONTAM: hypothetical protein GTU68_051591 [Idotea baltica]|nr:hypothetical protein [Idotea baltica]